MVSLAGPLGMALPHVALVRLRGPIGTRIDPTRYERLFGALARIPTTRAVVLEWDSPGGGVTASEELKGATKRLAAAKPVVSYVAGTCASGGYMAAVAAQRVVALPTAIVGSIGVISLRPVLSELLRKVGVGFDVTKTGPFKDMGAFYRDPTAEEKEKQEELIGELFDGFVQWVAEARGMDVADVRKVATGEVFTGRRAADLGLVDEVGDRTDAVRLAARLGRTPARAVELSPPRSLLEQLNPAAAGAALVRGVLDELRATSTAVW